MARALRFAVTVVVAVVAVIGLLLFFASRDSSTFNRRGGPADAGRAVPPPAAPARPAVIRRDRVTLSAAQLATALRAGDVVFLYGSRGDEPRLLRVQEDAAGPFDSALARAGAAIVLGHDAGRTGVEARAFGRTLDTATPDDPRLPGFAETWLGHGAGR